MVTGFTRQVEFGLTSTPPKVRLCNSDSGITALFFFATLTSHIWPNFSNACACIVLQPDCHAYTLDSHDVRSLALSH